MVISFVIASVRQTQNPIKNIKLDCRVTPSSVCSRIYWQKSLFKQKVNLKIVYLDYT